MKLNRYQLWERLMSILRRHVKECDNELSDDKFVRKVFERYGKHRGEALIDPAE